MQKESPLQKDLDVACTAFDPQHAKASCARGFHQSVTLSEASTQLPAGARQAYSLPSTPESVASPRYELSKELRESPPSPRVHMNFRNFFHAAYKTIFVDTPARARPSKTSKASRQPSNANLKSQGSLESQGTRPWNLKAAPGPSSAEEKENHWVHTLGAGEASQLNQGLLCQTDVASPSTTRKLQGGRRPPPIELKCRRRPWSKWWAEKRMRDAGLVVAATSGDSCQLKEALITPRNGNAPILVNSRSPCGQTALHLAAAAGNLECVKLLLGKNAELEACTEAGLSTLHIACRHGHTGITLLLLHHGADLLPQTNDYNLPLHLAAANGHADLVSMLLEHGAFTTSARARGVYLSACLNWKNAFGQQPADVSLDLRTAEVFAQYGSRPSSIKGSAFSEHVLSTDLYAGRTPYHSGAVLIHNARADIVRRCLHRMKTAPMLCIEDLPEEVSMGHSLPKRMISGLSTASTASSTRGPFVRIRTIRSLPEVGPDSFDFLAKIGKGAYGQVFEVRHHQTHDVYAMKIIRKTRIKSDTEKRGTKTERDVLTYMHHPYIVRLHFAFQTTDWLALVLQFCPGGTVQQLIDKSRKLDESLARLYTAEMLLALIHLHELQIIFRDMKPDNIVLDEAGHGILTDFGLSKAKVSDKQAATSFCGSAAYLAPEILLRQGHGKGVDVYGLGVLLFTMLTGLPPFYYPDRAVLFDNIKHASLVVPKYVPQHPKSLLESLLKREPYKRLGAQCIRDIKDHRFFASIDFNALMKRKVPVPRVLSAPLESSTATTPPGDRQPLENPFSGKKKRSSRKHIVSDWTFHFGKDLDNQ